MAYKENPVNRGKKGKKEKDCFASTPRRKLSF